MFALFAVFALFAKFAVFAGFAVFARSRDRLHPNATTDTIDNSVNSDNSVNTDNSANIVNSGNSAWASKLTNQMNFLIRAAVL